jgi:osmotically-inducible protein OsmY
MFRKDTDIQKDILDELKWEPAVKQTDIGVIVKDGAVVLTGTVPSYTDKLAAHSAAKRINGVRSIADKIEVKLPAQMAGSDEDIAQRVAQILEWNVQIPSDSIKPEVRKGIVTLSGTVDWQFQRSDAQRQIEGIKGVKSIINSITLRSQAAVTDVKHEIEEALRRHANTEAAKVRVSVIDGAVTLSGDVDSYAEMGLIEDAAWATKGVTKVIDNLRII